ncbi:MAG: ATP-binding protein [Prolixibacteraceae bacterium]|jgi:ATP-dependent DNA helicase RecG
MGTKEYQIGNKYSPRELMELAVEEMRKSIPDPNRDDNKPNPKVGAVIATKEGILLSTSHRGELRIGDHAEFTAIERKKRGEKLDGNVVYATLEPCAPGARNHPKLSCAERIVNARFAKVYIGHIDPDPSVAGDGRDFILSNNIEVGYFDDDLVEIIYQENKKFFDDASIRAHEFNSNPLLPKPTILSQGLGNFDITDLSEEAQQDLIDRLNLSFKIASDGFIKYLSQLGLVFKEKDTEIHRPTGMGLLLLGRNPQVEFEQSRIKFTIEQSVGDAKIKDIEGPLLLMPGKVEDLLDLSFLPEINRENFHREEIIDISKKVLRELIINAIVHRDYTIKDKQVRIVASKEKIEIWSPGAPIIGLDKFKKFEVPPISRNPKLAYIFFKTGLVEERGIGMKELKAFRDDNSLPSPTFRIEHDYFIITVFRKKVSSAIEQLNEEELLGYQYLQKQKRVSKKQYTEHFKMDEKKAQRHLLKFKKLKLVKPIGGGPKTEYVLI